MTKKTFGGISTEGSDVSVTIEVVGPDKDEARNVARHARDAAVRAMQAHAEGKHPDLTDGCPISVDWNKVDAVDDTPGPFPNGVYLIADTPRTATPLAVEDGSGDRDLLREALSNHDAIDDSDTDFPTDEPGDTYMTDGGVDEDTLRRAVNAVDDGRVKSAQYNAERGRGRFLVDSGDIDEDDVVDTMADHGFDVVGTIPAVDITQVDVEPADDQPTDEDDA
jgi:hypothetical protein